MKTSRILVTLFAGICLLTPLFAQENKDKLSDKAARKAMHEEMQADMKAMDEQLDRLVIDMNTAATPDKKLDSAIAVINQMVTNQKKMHEKMHRFGGDHHHHGDKPGE